MQISYYYCNTWEKTIFHLLKNLDCILVVFWISLAMLYEIAIHAKTKPNHHHLMQQTTRENEMFRCRLQGQSQLCCNNHTSGYLLSQSFISRDWHVAFRQANNNQRKKHEFFFLFGVWSIQQKLNWNYAQQKLEFVVYAVIVKIHNTRTANNNSASWFCMVAICPLCWTLQIFVRENSLGMNLNETLSICLHQTVLSISIVHQHR